MAEDDRPRRGYRKDGTPYKEGNTRADGSYGVGKNRAPKAGRFAKDDGRARGVRPKGTKNLLTDWREELEIKIPVTEGGKTRKVTKRRATIKSSINRALKGSDKAAEFVLHNAALSEKRAPGLQADDLEIIEAWFSRQTASGDSDDYDQQPPTQPNHADGTDG